MMTDISLHCRPGHWCRVHYSWPGILFDIKKKNIWDKYRRSLAGNHVVIRFPVRSLDNRLPRGSGGCVLRLRLDQEYNDGGQATD